MMKAAVWEFPNMYEDLCKARVGWIEHAADRLPGIVTERVNEGMSSR